MDKTVGTLVYFKKSRYLVISPSTTSIFHILPSAFVACEAESIAPVVEKTEQRRVIICLPFNVSEDATITDAV